MGDPCGGIAGSGDAYLPRLCLAGLYAAFSLMTMFTAYIVAILRFSDYVPCSCGGVLQNMTWNQHLVFNIAFVLLALTGIILKEPGQYKKAPFEPFCRLTNIVL